MTTTQTTPAPDTKQKRFKGSLAGKLVGTLLIFTLIPLAFMAGVAYFRARTLLREQAIAQSQHLLTNQLKIIDRELNEKEVVIENQLANPDFGALLELALHANPQSNQFRGVRNDFIKQFQDATLQEGTPVFNQFLLIDTDGFIKIASNEEWQGQKLDPAIFSQTTKGFNSVVTYGLAPVYENQFILITAINYETARGSNLGLLLGITEKDNLVELMQPLNGLSPLASTYFLLSNNQLIYSDPSSGDFTPVNTSPDSQSQLAAKLSEQMNSDQLRTGALEITSPSGEAVLAQLQWFPQMQSGVVLEVNAADIYGQVSSLAPFTFVLVSVTILAIVLLMIVIVNRVIKPLQSLSEITQGFASGNWNRRANVFSNDEIGLLAYSFNNMADELSNTYRSLEQKVDERTKQIYTAAEVAQNITTSNIEDMLNHTAELIIKQFGFYQASIFMVESGGKHIEFKTGAGAATQELASKDHRIEVGSSSIIGWVSKNNQPRIASEVLDNEANITNELLSGAHSEVSVPISIGELVLGVLDVQSIHSNAFNPETIVLLQTLASQMAAAIQTTGLAESSQVNFAEIERLYRSSRLIAKADSEADVLKISHQILQAAPYSTAMLHIQGNRLEVLSRFDSSSKFIEATIEEINNYLLRGPVISQAARSDVPASLRNVVQSLESDNVAFLPIRKHETLVAIAILGASKRNISHAAIQPYINLVELISTTLEKVTAIKQTERHLREVESLASINELIASTSNIQGFFKALLDKIHQILGNYGMIVALYDEKSNTISIPFSYENEKISSIESFPLGEGLTSILIRTRQPLMLVEDTERKAVELGAKLIGKPARSWMGAPMLINNHPIGALIIQDLENEHAFDVDDLHFFTTLTGQVAGAINNVNLLNESQQRAIQLETTAEIARDISGSLNLDELLIKAVNFVRERFDFYHASIFLHDLPGEFAIIREATGEAGAQMKRAGYKIGIGSKSIVGFVSSRGEQLVVNDTTKDATYYANPLLPDTRSEAAIPLKVGERILGAMDVQSTKPYAFSTDNLRSLQILADQLAVAVVNTELFAETQEHLSQHRLLHHITTTAASGKTLEEALEGAVNGLQVTLGGDRVMILLADREKRLLEVKASTGYAEDVASLKFAIGSGVTGWVAAHKRPLRVRDTAEDPRYVQISSNTRSELAVPLIYRNELLGVLNVESEQIDAYNENDEEMLGTLGGSLAAIIANARLVEQIRIQAERERLIYEVTSKIRRSTDIQSILMTTASELTRITGARYARIHVKPVNDPSEEES